MQTSLVMTVIGADKPGLVESLASLIARHNGNWLESRMSHLGGQFAGILRVAVPAEQQAALLHDLAGLKARGLTVVVQEDAAPPATGPTPVRLLEIVGQDRPGIVREITRALASRGVNVEEFSSECSSAAMSGEAMFTARVKVGIPPGCDLADLRAAVEKAGQDLILDVVWQEAGETS